MVYTFPARRFILPFIINKRAKRFLLKILLFSSMINLSLFFIIKIPADLLFWSQPYSLVNNQKTGFIPLWLTVFFLASVLGWALHPLRQGSTGFSLSLSAYVD
jgi:uncharacterized membrane protein